MAGGRTTAVVVLAALGLAAGAARPAAAAPEVALRVAADRPSVAVGDLVTLELAVDGGAEPLTAAARRPLYLRLLLPRGLAVAPGSAAASVDHDGAAATRRPLVVRDEPRSERVVRLGPIDVPAGGRLRARVQLVVGLDRALGDVGGRRSITAVAIDGGGVALSAASAVELAVVADDALDQAPVVGRVFCDDDRDGTVDVGEPGAVGARVRLETGLEAIADLDGRWHFARVAPGPHVVKLDADSLAGGRILGAATRRIDLGAGAPAELVFAVECGLRRVVVPARPTAASARGGGDPSASPRPVRVAGVVGDGVVSIDGVPHTLPRARLARRAGGPLVAPGAAGWSPPLELALEARSPVAIARWTVTIERIADDGAATRVRGLAGDGAPPAAIGWDGRDDAGRPAIPGHHRARLRVHAAGRIAEASSDPLDLVIAGGAPPAAETWDGGLFVGSAAAPRPTPRLAARIARLAAALAPGDELVIESHFDGTGERIAALARTQREAELVARLLVAAGVRAPIKPRGRGSLEPVAPGVAPAARRANRRVVARIKRPGGAPPAAALARPDVAIDGRPVALGADRAFAETVRPRGDAILVDVRGVGGGHAALAIPLGRAAPTPGGGQAGAATRALEIAGDLGVGALRLGDRTVPAALLALEATPRAPRLVLAGDAPAAAPAAPLELAVSPPSPPGVARWRLIVEERGGPEVARLGDDGAPPPTIRWDGRIDGAVVARPGQAYLAHLELDSTEGDTARAPPVAFVAERAGARPIGAGGGPRGRLFAGEARLTTGLKNWLSSAVGRAGRGSLALELVVALPPELDGAAAAARVAARADALRGYLARLGVGPARLALTARGDRAATEDRLARAGSMGPVAAVAPAPLPTPGARIDGVPIALDGERFATRVELPEGGAALIDLTRPSGQRLLARVVVPPPASERAADLAVAGPPAALPPASAAPALVVFLPPSDRVLPSRALVVRGEAAPGARVAINGRAARAAPDGRFAIELALPSGAGELVVEAPGGDVLRWPVRVADHEVFALGLGEASIGAAWSRGGWTAGGAPAPGLDDATALGPVALAGRAAGFVRARWSDVLGLAELAITARVDSARRGDGPLIAELDDPTRAPPALGDAAVERQLADARGPLYLRIDADRSRLEVGSVRADLAGGALFRHQRAGDGAAVTVDRALGDHHVTARAVAIDDGALGAGGRRGALGRDVNLFRATGGALYVVRRPFVAEGSEVVTIVTRHRDRGGVLAERRLVRDVDYSIDYPGGRIVLVEPLASTARGDHLLGSLEAGLGPLGGHPVFLQVDYQHHGGASGAAHGGYARDTIGGRFSLGVGGIGERRPGGDYGLVAADVAGRIGARSRVAAEVAVSRRLDAVVGLSTDGGLSFGELDRLGAGPAAAGRQLGWRGEIDLALSDVVPLAALDHTRVVLTGQELDRGFGAADAALDQGRRTIAARVEQRVGERDRLVLSHDHRRALLARVGPTPADVLPLDAPLDRRIDRLTALSWAGDRGRWHHAAELGHQRSTSDARLVDGARALDARRIGAAASTALDLSRRVTLRVAQEVSHAVRGADPILAPLAGDGRRAEPLAGVATSAGAELRLIDELALATSLHQRWNGDRGAELGLRTPLGTGGSFYVAERIGGEDGRARAATVVGADERLGEGGRSFGELQLEHGAGGPRERAVLGLGRRFRPSPGLGLALGLEHQEVLGGVLPDGTPLGEQRRDVAHGGAELARGWLTASGQLELRFDQGAVATPIDPIGDPRPGAPPGGVADHGGPSPGVPVVVPAGERTQLLLGLGAAARLSPALQLFGRGRLIRTLDGPSLVGDAALIQRTRELTLGVALRPLGGGVRAIARYSALVDRRPPVGPDDGPEARSHVVALLPWVALPRRIVLAGKLAAKSTRVAPAELGGLDAGSTRVRAGLALARLGVGIGAGFDLTLEGRALGLATALGKELLVGNVMEVGYTLVDHLRFAAGYNFSHFSDDELGELDRDEHGPFARVSGSY